MFNVYKNYAAYPGYSSYKANPNTFPLIAMFDTVLQQYAYEVVDFVEESVKRKIHDVVRRNNNQQTVITKARLAALKAWTELPHPFATTNDSLSHLSLAMNSTTQYDGVLPGADLYPPLTLKEFAQCSLVLARSKYTSTVFAPFFARSITANLMRVAYTLSHVQLASAEPSARDELIEEAITLIVEKLKIHNLPWSLPRAPGGGRQAQGTQKPTIACWRTLDFTITTSASIARNLILRSNDPLAITRLNIKAASVISHNGEWNIGTLALSDLRRYSHKTVNPNDFVIHHASVETDAFQNPNGEQYWVYQHYLWVFDTFKFRKPAHRLLMYCARIFAATAPYLVGKAPKVVPVLETSEEMIRHIQSYPLYIPKRKGIKAALPLIVLWTGMAMGMLHNDSPLGKHLSDEDTRGSFGPVWTEKHGKHLRNNDQVHA